MSNHSVKPGSDYPRCGHQPQLSADRRRGIWVSATSADPIEYRKRALRCSGLAERATNSQVKAVLTYLAEHWLKMAVDLECAQPWPEGFEPSAKD